MHHVENNNTAQVSKGATPCRFVVFLCHEDRRICAACDLRSVSGHISRHTNHIIEDKLIMKKIRQSQIHTHTHTQLVPSTHQKYQAGSCHPQISINLVIDKKG